MATRQLWRQVDRNLYAVLGVDRVATHEQIHRAWKAAAKSAHPDGGGDEDSFRAVHIAYLVLSDPETRRDYDRLGSPGDHAVWEADAPRRQADDVPAPATGRTRPLLLWALVVAAVSAVVGAYLWPVLTLVTGSVVGLVVLIRYHRRGFGLFGPHGA